MIVSHVVYVLGIALLAVHELDAIRHHEWRLFFFLRPFSDTTAYQIFTLLHIPLFFIFMWRLAYPTLRFEIAVDIFLIVHAGLHYLFRNHPNYEFRGWVSHGIIAGATLMGALHLVLLAT